MFHSLMVPLDGSAFGEQAVPFAVSLARRAGAKIELARVHEPPMPPRESAIGMELLDEHIRTGEQDYLNELNRSVSAATNVPLETRLLDGLVVDALCRHAADTQSDLVVMTTHGRGPLSRFWLGGVADKLLRQLPVPVLLVRPSEGAVDFAQEPALRHVLIPLDGSEFAEQILDTALALGALTQADYTLLRVVPVAMVGSESHSAVARELALGPSLLEQARQLPENARREAENYLGGVAERLRTRGCRVQTQVLNHWNPAAAILEIADTQGVDLVAMATHGHGGLTRMLLGSVADKVIRGATKPILVYAARG